MDEARFFEDAGERIAELRAIEGGARVSVIVGRRRAATVSAAGAARIGLREGGAWDEAIAARVAEENAFERAHRDAVRWIAPKERTSAEVRARLGAKGHDAAAIERVIADLERTGAIDDRRVAEMGAAELMEARGQSSRAARARLEARGVGADEAARAVREGEETDDARALEEARRHAQKAPAGQELAAARRALGALARRGFDEDTAREAVRRAFAERGVRLDDEPV